MDEYPILQTKGLKLKKFEVVDGHMVITLTPPRSSEFSEPIVIVVMVEAARVMFTYTILDPETKTVRRYTGRTGNPALDDYVIEGV